MSRDTRKLRDDRDGIRIFEISGGRRRPGIAVLAVATLAAVAALYLFRGPEQQAAPPVSVPPLAWQPVASVPARPMRKAPAAQVDEGTKPNRRRSTSDRAADRVPANPKSERGQDSTRNAAAEGGRAQLESLARDLIEGLRASGETGGIAAFPPPGTNPVKTGIVVPENFELPEGYVRYYQVTDDGRRLEPILMFSPDYDFVGHNGQAIALPKDGIVPPDMAPPGLPVRMLEIPKAPYAGGAEPR